MASGILSQGSLLAAAARFYLERRPSTLPQTTLAEAAAEMIELRRNANASEAYLADLRFRASRFISAFPGHSASHSLARCPPATSDRGVTGPVPRPFGARQDQGKGLE